MAHRGFLAEVAGNPPYVDFGNVTLAAWSAFAWDHTAIPGTPILANGTTTHIAGVTSADGKGGFLAIPGGIVLIQVASGVTITANNLYDVGSSGLLSGTAGTHFRALEALAVTLNNSTGVIRRLIAVEFWKPKG